jgi:hypothetical protein
MPKKIPSKKKIEKDIKEEKKVWKSIQKIHKKDQSFLEKLKRLFKKR